MKIHNPRNFQLTVAEIAAGWRICFLEELKKAIPRDAEFWSETNRRWESAPASFRGGPMNSGDEKVTTFRTKTPKPEPDALEELVKFLS